MLKRLTEGERVGLDWAARIVQGIIILLVGIVGWFTADLIESTEKLADRMDQFSEKVVERINDLDKRVAVLEDRQRYR
jgi:predicted PurR-regulated permease PerM